MISKNIFQIIFAALKKRDKFIIWCDRYLYDIFADPRRYRISKDTLEIKFIKKFIVKPNLTIIINPPVEDILKRSEELSYEELNKLNKSYFNLHKNFPETIYINSEGSLEKITNICALYLDKLFK